MQFAFSPQPWNTEQIAAIEDEIGVLLPDDYRRFLLDTGAGYLPKRIVPGTNDNAILDTLCTFNDLGVIISAASDWYPVIPDRYHPVASGRGGVVCIGLAADIAGQVFWADFDHAVDLGLVNRRTSSEQIMTLLYPTWGDFVIGYDGWELV